jgi:hypothetical protein
MSPQFSKGTNVVEYSPVRQQADRCVNVAPRVRVSVKTRKQRRVTTTHSSRGVPDARYVDAMRSFHTDSSARGQLGELAGLVQAQGFL